MSKRTNYIAGAVILTMLLGSCKEKGLNVDLGLGPVAKDTTFMASPEAAQPRVVLMEECTGVSCPPCPKAHVVLASLKTMYGDKLSIIGIQVFDFGQADPVLNPGKVGDTLTKHDNRTQAGTELATDLFSKISSIPGGGIDRFSKDPGTGRLYLAKDYWPTEVANRIIAPTVANVSITSNYNPTTKQAVIKVHIAYTGTTTKKQKLNVALIENDIIDAQKDGTNIVLDYRHEHVLRDILTLPTGSAILHDSTIKSIEPGRVYERTFVYDMSQHPLWVPANCRIVAYICNAEPNDKEVLQTAEIALQ